MAKTINDFEKTSDKDNIFVNSCEQMKDESLQVRNPIQKTKCKEAKKTVVDEKSKTQKDNKRLLENMLVSKDEENILVIHYDLEFYYV